MALFFDDPKLEYTQTRESRAAGGYMQGLMGQQLTMPTQQVAGISPFQSQILQSLQAAMPQINQQYQVAAQQLGATARGEYDPYTSPYYQSLREEGERAKRQATTAARERAEMGGALYSTPAAGVEAGARAQIETALQSELARLYETERGRQLGAAQALPQLGAQQIAQYGQALTLEDFQRQVQQQQYNALYQQAMSQILAPYQYNAAIAQALYQPQAAVTGGGLSDVGFGLTALMGGLQTAFKAGIGGGGGATSSPSTSGTFFGTPGMMR